MNEVDITKDYVYEIANNFKTLFSDFLFSYFVEYINPNHTHINSGTLITQQIHPSYYRFQIRLQLLRLQLLRDPNFNSIEVVKYATLPSYSPSIMSVDIKQQDNLSEAMWTVILEYQIFDLVDFAEQLKQHSWSIYNNKITAVIEEKLDN